MARFDSIIKTAKRLIEKNGQEVVWQVLRDGDPIDPDKPWEPSEGTTDPKNVTICFVPKTDGAMQKFLAYLKGTEVSTSKLSGLMAPVDFEPKLKDVVIRDGEELVIKDFELINPNGQKILYILEFDA